jgi:hypothetical protein
VPKNGKRKKGLKQDFLKVKTSPPSSPSFYKERQETQKNLGVLGKSGALAMIF